jgi:hypothetical protein
VSGPIAQAIQESTIFVCLVGQNVLRNRLLFLLSENSRKCASPGTVGLGWLEIHKDPSRIMLRVPLSTCYFCLAGSGQLRWLACMSLDRARATTSLAA